MQRRPAAIPLAPAQDFKRLGDGDAGPNTGGMGAYSPVPIAGPGLVEEVMASAVEPTLRRARGARHRVPRGAVRRAHAHAGRTKVLEYNVRFGDPECQVVLPRLSSDLAVLCVEAARGACTTPVTFTDDACVTVVLASEGYPIAPRTGDAIAGLDDAAALDGVYVFHAGTARDGDTLRHRRRPGARRSAPPRRRSPRPGPAYDAVGRISWPGMQYRTDIAADVTTELT